MSRKLTDEQKAHVAAIVRDSERMRELMYEDMIGEIGMRFDLDDDEVYELIDELEK